jgi:membrane protein
VAHELVDRAGLLSYYFLLALFPLLIVLTALMGFFLSSQTSAYWRLLEYLARFMPPSAFLLFSNVIHQITAGATSGKLSIGLILALWTSSSGIAALIEALNRAFGVPAGRTWWRRRLVAIGLTLSLGAVLGASLIFLFATSSAGAFITARLPVTQTLHAVSSIVRWLVGFSVVFLALTFIYGFGPNLKRRRWEGILPGSMLALLCWLGASWGLRAYLSTFGSLGRSYGSLAGVIALLFWLYSLAMAILLGGELNAIIWQTVTRPAQQT